MAAVMNIFLRAVFIGLKGVALFYLAGNARFICPALPPGHDLWYLFIGGLSNGLLNPAFIFIKNRSKGKFLLFFTGLASTAAIFILTLNLRLPDRLADYFVYGEGGGGLEAGGWFAFNYSTLVFFGVSFFFSSCLTVAVLSYKTGRLNDSDKMQKVQEEQNND